MLKDARSKLFVHVRRVYELCKKHFRWSQVHYFMESVFSMDAKDRATMSADIGVTPYLVDAAGISICRRPRLYWLSWELRWAEGVQISEGTGVGWELYRVITLDSVVGPADYLCQGCTTARPRAQPGNRPAGLWQCQSWELERWQQDDHRYPPYVYRDKHCLVNSVGDRRLPNIAEKEAAMGFPVGYTAPCLPKSKQKGTEYSDVRHTLIGNSWHVPVVAWLLKESFAPLGLVYKAAYSTRCGVGSLPGRRPDPAGIPPAVALAPCAQQGSGGSGMPAWQETHQLCGSQGRRSAPPGP